MILHYKNRNLERVLVGVNILAAMVVTATFVVLFGFDKPLVKAEILYTVQAILLFVFICEMFARFFNAVSMKEFLRVFWFQIPLLIALIIVLAAAGRYFAKTEPAPIRQTAIGIYLIFQVVIKVCRTVVNMAASGRNPTRTLIISFLVLIISGAGLLMLPKSVTGENLSFVDALFTATSATCVTGLIVKDTGADFTFMGQIIILSLIQLGGLGIVVFGVVIALLLGQALGLRESVAMQDLLSARTLGQIGRMIAFIFVGTLTIEAIGAVSMLGLWNEVPGRAVTIHEQWFASIFHSISAFCNAGFSLFDDSLISYERNWSVYLVICPLIILGGLGFGVLYDITNIITDKTKRFLRKKFGKNHGFNTEAPKRMRLQTKIVLTVSTALIIFGMISLLIFEHYTGLGTSNNGGVLGAFFQSVTARTAGFNTIDVASLSDSGKFILIILMFIGGSPGSTAGGIKTVTLAVVVMTAVAALRKRSEVEMFKRSIKLVVVGRAITVTLLFVVVLFGATLALNITENGNEFGMSDILFEAASALGTVGLTTGITASLTNAGKLIIILVMLIGRLGPLTLLAALTFNLKPVGFNYPDEVIIVG